MHYVVKAARCASDLTGEGEEWLLDAVTGEILARFWNGNFLTTKPRMTGDAMEGTTLQLEEAA